MRIDIHDKKEFPGSSPVRIFDVAEFSAYDGPGIRTVVYFQQCNVRCDWCHSPQSQPRVPPLMFNANMCMSCGRCVQICGNGVHSFDSGAHLMDRRKCVQCGKCVERCPGSVAGVKGSALHLPVAELTVASLFGQIAPYIRLCGKGGGVTLSGGEALMQDAAAEELLMRCRREGINTAVETSGLLPAVVYRRFIPLVDTWLFGMRVITGSGRPRHDAHIDKTLQTLVSAGANVLPRIPMVPGFYDRDDILGSITEIMARHSVNTVCLNPWNRNYDINYIQSGISLTMPAPTERQERDCESKIRTIFTNLKFKIYENNDTFCRRNDTEGQEAVRPPY